MRRLDSNNEGHYWETDVTNNGGDDGGGDNDMRRQQRTTTRHPNDDVDVYGNLDQEEEEDDDDNSGLRFTPRSKRSGLEDLSQSPLAPLPKRTTPERPVEAPVGDVIPVPGRDVSFDASQRITLTWLQQYQLIEALHLNSKDYKKTLEYLHNKHSFLKIQNVERLEGLFLLLRPKLLNQAFTPRECIGTLKKAYANQYGSFQLALKGFAQEEEHRLKNWEKARQLVQEIGQTERVEASHKSTTPQQARTAYRKSVSADKDKRQAAKSALTDIVTHHSGALSSQKKAQQQFSSAAHSTSLLSLMKGEKCLWKFKTSLNERSYEASDAQKELDKKFLTTMELFLKGIRSNAFLQDPPEKTEDKDEDRLVEE